MTTRTRTRGVLQTGDTNRFTTTTFGGTVVVSDGTPFAALEVGETQTTTDVVTPRFHARIAAGEIINNPFRSDTIVQSHTFSGHHIRKDSGSGSTIRDYEWKYGYTIPDALWGWGVDTSAAMAEASTEAAAKVEETNVDGAVEAFEGRQTMQLFDLRQWSLRQQILKEIRYAEKRGKKFPVSAPASVMANNWLFYRYGIGPAVRLLHDTIVVGSRIQTRRQISRGFGETGGNSVDVLPVQSGSFHNATTTRSKQWQSDVRAGILYERRSFTNQYGFSLANIPGAFWEIVPWSFVVDWGLNMGDFIRALTPRVQSIRRATWLVQHTTVDQLIDVSLGPVKVAGHTVVKNQSGAFQRRAVAVRRIPQILSPTLYIRENALAAVANSQRAVDAFALTWQLLHKLMRRS